MLGTVSGLPSHVSLIFVPSSVGQQTAWFKLRQVQVSFIRQWQSLQATNLRCYCIWKRDPSVRTLLRARWYLLSLPAKHQASLARSQGYQKPACSLPSLLGLVLMLPVPHCPCRRHQTSETQAKISSR